MRGVVRVSPTPDWRGNRVLYRRGRAIMGQSALQGTGCWSGSTPPHPGIRPRSTRDAPAMRHAGRGALQPCRPCAALLRRRVLGWDPGSAHGHASPATQDSARERRSPSARSRARAAHGPGPPRAAAPALWSREAAGRRCARRRHGHNRARLTEEIFQSKVLEDYDLNFSHSCVHVEASWWASRVTSSADNGRCNAWARRKRVSTETFR